ncbi:hypothetical protein HY312_01510 [Candidatus Saccharibacteria bacterium]|nr:hypothetical protein [Candidatus Saccharibacteria bacterium]
MQKSVDGINRTPISHDIYLAKRRLDSNRQSFVSIQRRESLKPVDRILSDIDLDLKPAPQRELVINVSRHFSIRASISIVVQYILIAAIGIASAYSTDIGQWFVLALAVYVIATRQDSRLTYGIALFIMISVPFFQIINQPGVANNMTIYVFELLVLGTLQSLIELKFTQKSEK